MYRPIILTYKYVGRAYIHTYGIQVAFPMRNQ